MSLKGPSENAEWPCAATGQPSDVIALAKEMVVGIFAEAIKCASTTGLSAEILLGTLSFDYGEVLMSEPIADTYMTVQTRYIRHFINVTLNEPVSEEVSAKLGLDSGHFTGVKGDDTNESDFYEWWGMGQCDEKLPGSTRTAHKKVGASILQGTSSLGFEFDSLGFQQSAPWIIDVLERTLRYHNVNIKPIRGLLPEIVKHLQQTDWTLVHRLHATDDVNLALVQFDGRAFFFPPHGCEVDGSPQ